MPDELDYVSLAHHLEAASSYAEQLGLIELQGRIDMLSRELKALSDKRGIGAPPPR